nr:fructosamine kinase family protein [Neptunitalea sp. Y10]
MSYRPCCCIRPKRNGYSHDAFVWWFSETLFKSYHNTFPLQNGWKKRLDIWQLYYLLVHLNLFGSSYLGSVKRIYNNYNR